MSFSESFKQTRSLEKGYGAGAHAAHVCKRTAFTWVKEYDANDGFFSLSQWGRHVKVPWKLADEDVQAKCRDWIYQHAPKPGVPNFTALDFMHYLVGDKRLKPKRTYGILNSKGPKGETPLFMPTEEDTS